MTQITTNPSLVEMEQLDEKIIELEQCLTWANNEDQYNEILRALSAYHHQMDIKAEDLEHCLGLKPGTGKAISTLIRNTMEVHFVPESALTPNPAGTN